MSLLVQHGMLINRGIVTCRIGNIHRILQRSFRFNPLGDTEVDQEMRSLCRAVTELAADVGQLTAKQQGG